MAKKDEFAHDEDMACDHMYDMDDEQLLSFVEVVKCQHKTSVELTKLVLEHGKFSDLTEAKIHKIFMNAADVVAKMFEKATDRQH